MGHDNRNNRLDITGIMPGVIGIALAFLLCCVNLPMSWAAVGSEKTAVDDSLFEMSIEDLMGIQVTSVSKKAQKISDAAAAVFVITSDDIRRSGATSIPELLRMVPGLQVARIDGNKSAVTSRGFNGYFANKLLVLIDGRSVYTPLFSGVLWDIQDLPLQDVERIEVIRGPGATLWGANAVNGVINILTKKTKDTQGAMVEAGYGSEERGFGTIRYGGKVNDRMHYRGYAKYFNRDEAVYSSGEDAHDDWQASRGGFRMDYADEDNDAITVQGDIYDVDVGQTFITAEPPPLYSQTYSSETNSNGGNFLGRWERVFSNTSDMTLQAYYDRTVRDDQLVGETRDTFDMDFQHRFNLQENNEIIWGLGYRYTRDEIVNSFAVDFTPDSRRDNLFSGFIQDEISMVDNLVRLTLGSKFEYNDYTGFEAQPNIRLLYKPADFHSVWASVSRSVRTPSRGETNGMINKMVLPPGAFGPGSPVAYIQFNGSDDFDSEKLLAFELGYRTQVKDVLSVDISTFYNTYDNLMTVEPHVPFIEWSPFPHLVVPYVAENKMDGDSYGVELALDWLYSDYFNLKTSYTYLKMRLSLDGDSLDPTSDSAEDDNPSHQISLRPSINLRKDLELDLWARYVSNIPNQDIRSYVSLDIRIAWKVLENMELSLVGQSLLDPQRLEYNQNTYHNVVSTEFQRGVYGKILWRF